MWKLHVVWRITPFSYMKEGRGRGGGDCWAPITEGCNANIITLHNTLLRKWSRCEGERKHTNCSYISRLIRKIRCNCWWRWSYVHTVLRYSGRPAGESEVTGRNRLCLYTANSILDAQRFRQWWPGFITNSQREQSFLLLGITCRARALVRALTWIIWKYIVIYVL